MPSTAQTSTAKTSAAQTSTAQKKAIQKADTLIEALGWIRKFRDTTTVIKLGGSVVEHPDSLRHLLIDIVFMSTLGMRVVVVHGGGKAMDLYMKVLSWTLDSREAHRRKALLGIGGFDEFFEWVYDDADVALRLADAGAVVSATSARVRHVDFLEAVE